MVLQRPLPVGLADLRQPDPSPQLGRDLQQLQRPLQGHGVLQGLEGGALETPPQPLHKSVGQGWDPQHQGGGTEGIVKNAHRR